MKLNLMKFLYESERWSLVEELIDDLSKDKRNYAELIYPLAKLRRAYFSSGRREKALQLNKRILRYYKKAKAVRSKIPLESLDAVADLKVRSLKQKVRELENVPLAFPEKVYNERLKLKFTLLDNITARSLSNLSIGSGKGIVKTYRILVESYQHLINSISTFDPPNKSKAYKASFRKNMENIVVPLRQKITEFKNQAKKSIQQESILSLDNYYFLSNVKGLPIRLRYFPKTKGVIMDKGGK